MVSKITAASVLRTFASKHLVVVQRDTLAILGSSGNMAHARATGAAEAGENGFRVVNLADVAGFDEAAASVDVVSAYVSALALGRTVAEIASQYRDRMDPRSIRNDRSIKRVSADDARAIVAESIRETIGSLSRVAARRQVAEWILEGAVG